MDGAAKFVDTTLTHMSKSVYKDFQYLRFQHQFLKSEPAKMDDTNKEYLERLQNIAIAEFETRKPAIDNFISQCRFRGWA